MAVKLYDGAAEDGLFNLQGKAIFAQKTAETALLTTVPAEVLDVITSHEKLAETLSLQRVVEGIAAAGESFKGNTSILGTLQVYCRRLLIEMVDADNVLPTKTVLSALKELIRQMGVSSDDVDASAVTAVVTADGGNTGDGKIVLSTKRGDGLQQENIIAEDVEIEATGGGETASLSFKGEKSVSLLSVEWPKGSGSASSISAVTAASSLLTNGGMEDEDDVTDAPDDWIFSVATIGTTVKMTDVEVQTIEMTGTHTAGHFLIHWTDRDGKALTTAPLQWDASASVVLAELSKFTGLATITVTATGTNPDETFEVTFVGAGGDVNQFTSTDNRTGGAGGINHATTTAGTPQVYAGGKAMEIDSDGAELTTFQQRSTALASETAYAISLWAIVDVVPAGGVITIDLIDGIAGAAIDDKQGVANTFTFNAADLTASFQHLSDLVAGETVFRMPTVVPDVVYFRIRTSTAISAGTSIWLDHISMTKMTELYAGGPYAAVFSGAADFKKGDKFTLVTTNDRAGELQEWYNRNFSMAQNGLLLPSDTGGAETIPDSVIS